VDVELADPELASVDNAIALLALGLAGFGAYRVFTEIGQGGGLVGWAFLLAGFLGIVPRVFLQMRLEDDELVVEVVSGTRTVDLAEVTGARVIDRWLLIRLGGVGTARYHTGNFYVFGEGHVKAYASRIHGPFVLLERREDRPVIVSPADPQRFRETVGSRLGR
jgi:hypothetical protein